MIVTDQARIEDWVRARKCDADLTDWAGVATEDAQGVIRCAVIFNHPTYRNINGHIVSDGSRRWASREFIWAMFHYPFIQLGLNRITAPIASSNLEARRFVERLGFTFEGALREFYPNGDSQIGYGLLRKDCRYV